MDDRPEGGADVRSAIDGVGHVARLRGKATALDGGANSKASLGARHNVVRQWEALGRFMRGRDTKGYWREKLMNGGVKD